MIVAKYRLGSLCTLQQRAVDVVLGDTGRLSYVGLAVEHPRTYESGPREARLLLILCPSFN